MDKKKKIAGIALAIAVFLIIGARICYVTAHARLPEQNVIAQGDSLTYRGLTYQIKGAVLWNYEDYFKEHPEYQSYQESWLTGENTKLLMVAYTVKKLQDQNVLETMPSIQYFHVFNQFDSFFFSDLNPALSDGTFVSGDTLYITYEIYKEVLTKEQWEQVENNQVVYEMVLGTYPVKTDYRSQI